MRKSYKRELGAAAFVVWAIVTGQIFFNLAPDDIAKYLGIYSTMSLPVWTFLAAAFGIHHLFPDGWEKDKSNLEED